MISLDLSILNQKGTPMFFSDTLAARPAFGIAGRIFIAIDSPFGVYRDTGSGWDQISGSGGGITGGGSVNTIAMFTPTGAAVGDSALSQTASNVTLAIRNFLINNGNLNLSHTHLAVNGLFNPFGSQIAVNNTINAGITWTNLLSFFNSSSLQTNNWNGSASFGNSSYTTNFLNLSGISFLAPGATITSTQASGGIRTWANQILQLRVDGTNSGTFTHYANSVIYGDFASSTARFNITNRYGYLVNDLDEYSAGHTYTNRWAFYNAGINDNNFFAGKVGIGSGYVPTTFSFDVVGTARIQGNFEVNKAQNSALALSIINTTNGINASAGLAFSSGGALAYIAKYSPTKSSYKIANSNDWLFSCESIGDLTFLADSANGKIKWAGGGVSTPQMILSSVGRLLLGTTTELTCAILNINSNSMGVLFPKMSTLQKNNINSPVSGLVVFDTDLNKLCVRGVTTWETITSV